MFAFSIWDVISELWTNMQVFAWVFLLLFVLILLYILYAFLFLAWPVHRKPELENMVKNNNFVVLRKIENCSRTIKFLNSLLPAVGLLGTLTGMYLAFKDTDFNQAKNLNETMSGLMRNFAIAMTTTLVGVLLRLGFDFLNHFLLDKFVMDMKVDAVSIKNTPVKTPLPTTQTETPVLKIKKAAEPASNE